MNGIEIARLAINAILNMDEAQYRRLSRSIKIIILGLICIPIYYFYLSIACKSTWLNPYIHKYCPPQKINLLSYLPWDDVTKNTESFAEALSNFDVTAPSRCVLAKSASIEIRFEIIHSDIDPEVKTKLVEVMLNMEQLMDKGADQTTNMSASFDKTLYTLPMHTEFLLDDLSKSKNSNNYQSEQLQIGMINISCYRRNICMPIV
jgi:hypothetical protein